MTISRTLLVLAAALGLTALGGRAASAQQALARDTGSAVETVQQPVAAPRVVPRGTGAPLSAGQRAELRVLRWLSGHDLPDDSKFAPGPRTIEGGTVVPGPIAIANGDLVVDGTLDGDAVVVGGNVILKPTGHITGDALTIGGRTEALGGRVDGDIRTIYALGGGGAAAAPAPPLTTWQMVKLVVGWFAVLFAIGFGVLMFAERNLDGVVIAMERGFGRAFWIGVLGQLALLPTLFLLCLGLVLTIIGTLLIPFAIVAYVIAVAGLVTLGFLAVSRLTGSALLRGGPVVTERGAALRGLVLGLVAYLGLWLIAAVFTWNPLVATVLRLVAFAATWVAATVGLGATLLSRAGTERGAGRPARKAVPDELAWQTPTPVTGVAAARRPVSRAG